ncbi:sirtuin 7 [Arctopsyche grandis]|uniref:sirtuin 7 n=1 Tax=Arctopsyche grandis TaxID=121162 RepID=UPI00406D8B8A
MQRRSGRIPAPPPPPPTTARATLLRQVSSILKKNESARSSEEVVFLAGMKDVVTEVNFRIQRRQETLDRSKEIEDENVILRSKCKRLAIAIEKAKHLVVYTGAGISTAADIPDYRGPNGIWTLLQQGKDIGKHDLTRADPTLTHMALWKLYTQRYLKFVVSQNCDGLHLRSGLPRRALSEVHGNMYIEICKSCKPNVQYWRLFDTTERTARYNHKTGRICHICGESLEDSIVHFGERGVAQWPLNWPGALFHAAKADVILCLGSSLKVLKKYPWLWAMNKPIKKRPAIFIVNLQWTPKDDVAVLKINGKCDNVMKLVMEYLDLETPNYNRVLDPIFAHTSYLCPKELHTTTQPMLIKATPVQKKAAESEDSDDDCPLNVLKMKMNPNDIEKPVDLSINASIAESFESKFSLDQSMDKCTSAEEELSLKSYIKDEDTLKGSSLVCDNSIKTNFEDSSECLKSDRYNTGPMDIECNKSINNNCKYNNNLEELSVEDDIDNFEKVHIEMRTSDSEICNVCILLVKNSKNGNSYNKYSNLNSNGITSIPSFNKRTNPILDTDINKNNDNAQDYDDSNNVRNNNILSKVSFPTIPSDFNVSQRDENNSSIVRPDFERYNFKNIHKSKDLNGVCTEKSIFRREKSISNVPYPLVNNLKSDEASSLTGTSEPLDFSLHSNLQTPFETRVFQIYNPHTPAKTFSKPAAVSSQNESTKCTIAIDLSFSKNTPVKTNSGVQIGSERDLGNGFSKNIRSPSEAREGSFAIFKRCEHFAKLIIQNTILVNRKELQYAYSGLHSIINPIPFYTEYDFTNIFNAFNFIKFAQKLLSKEKSMNINRVRGPIFKNEQIKKRKFGFKQIKPQRKEPVCKFCFEHYKSYVCNFYASFNSEERFEKWHKGKLIMCDCCGDTDTSDSETESSDASCDSVQGVHSEVISLSEVNDNNLLNNDLKNCVQISVNTDKIQGESVQAGWFGKGFRKSRRRKR